MSLLVSRSEREVADGRLQATVVMNELRKIDMVFPVAQPMGETVLD